jgi:hypothetical protein
VRRPSRTDLADAARRFNAYARLREAGGEPYVTLEAASLSLAERFRGQVGGLGEVVGELWYATGFEPVQAVVAMLWPWLAPEARERARAVLGARAVSTTS